MVPASGIDVLLFVVGSVLALLFGVGVVASDATLSVPALGAGVFVSLLAAGFVRLRRDRLVAIFEWFGESRRGRLAFLGLVAVGLLARLAVGLAPEPAQDRIATGMVGVALGMVALALARASVRALAGE